MAKTTEQAPSTQQVVETWLQSASQLQEKDIPELIANRQAMDAQAAVQQSAIDKKTAAEKSAAAQQADLIMQSEARKIRMSEETLPEDLSLSLAASVREATRAMQDTLSQVQQKKSIGMLDNPVAYVLNTLQLPELQNKLDTSVETVNTLSAARDKLNDSISTEARRLDAVRKTVTPGIVNAQADAMAAQADVLKASASMDAIKNNTSSLLQQQQLDYQSRMAVDRANDAFMRGQQFAMAQQRMNLDVQMANMQLDKARRAAADDVAEDRVVSSLMQSAYLHAQATGDSSLPPVTGLAEFKALLKMPGMAEKVQYHASLGVVTANSGNLMYSATSPSEAVHGILTNGLKVSPGSKEVVDAVLAAQDRYIKDPKNGFEQFAGNPKKQQAILDQVAKQAVQSMPLLTPEAVVEQEKGAKVQMLNMPLFKAIEWDTNPAVRKDSAAFRAAVTSAVAAKKISIEDAAAGITYFSSRQADSTNRYYNVLGFGVPSEMNAAVNLDGKVYNLSKVEDSYKWLASSANPSGWGKLFGRQGIVSGTLSNIYTDIVSDEARKQRTAELRSHNASNQTKD